MTTVTGVTGWADTFAAAVVVHESRSNPSQPPMAVAEQELTDAIKLLGSQPGFARNQLWLREQMEKARMEGPAECNDFGTPARSELAFKWLDIRAEAFVRFVTSIHTQNAFITLLARARREAWRDFTGHYVEVVQPCSNEFCEIFEGIHRRTQFWISKGYERLVGLEELPSGHEASPPKPEPQTSMMNNIDASIQQLPLPKDTGRDQRALVDGFIEKIAAAGRKITRMDIWRAAGYKHSSEFQRWQRRDPRACRSAAINFNRVLKMSAESFISALEKHSQ